MTLLQQSSCEKTNVFRRNSQSRRQRKRIKICSYKCIGNIFFLKQNDRHKSTRPLYNCSVLKIHTVSVSFLVLTSSFTRTSLNCAHFFKEGMLFTLDACCGIWLQSTLRLVVEMNFFADFLSLNFETFNVSVVVFQGADIKSD
jgi:hypothetical protein